MEGKVYRSDRKHRQTVRLPTDIKGPLVEMAFNFINLSENTLICKAIDYAVHSPEFIAKLEAIYPARKNVVWIRGRD